MKMQFSERLDYISEGIFAALNKKKLELESRGKKIYNLSIGTPDFKPAPHVMQAVSDACLKPEKYKYAITDQDRLVQALVDFYKTRFGVTLQKNELMTIYGSQEGMAHICMALTNPGDLVLVPDPGYPIFEMGPLLNGANVEKYALYPEKDYVLDLQDIPEEIAQKAKVIIVSYPLNPVCATAPAEFYEELIAFAKKYEIIVLHDNAYSDIIFDGSEGRSFLSFPGAKDVGAEFYSLSKSYNLTGARISFVVGNAKIIEAFQKIRSQIDYGIFLPVQEGAIAALTGPQDAVKAQREEYARRNQALCQGLTEIGWPVQESRGTMFVWAKLPAGYENSLDFCMELVEKTGVLVTPGSSFGSRGEGYVRMALVLDVETIKELVEAIRESGMF
jgi:LL-diaminopimelate aminotransferase